MAGTRAEWRESGLSDRAFRGLVESGGLIRVRHGCYVTREIFAKAEADPCLKHAVAATAAVTANRRQGSVVSYHSAARILGIGMLHPPDENVITVTVPPGRKTGRHSGTDLVCHAAALPAEHVTEFRGLSHTTAARTVVDIARISTFMQGVVAADSALQRKLVSKNEIKAVISQCARWPGIDMARRVTGFASWVAESPLESCARVVFHEHGLPPPVLQAPILGRNGRRAARGDFCWPGCGVIAESDGMAKYLERGVLKDHYSRDERIREVGWEVVHFSWDELFADPASIVTRIRFAFERAKDPSAVKRREAYPQAVAMPRR